VKNHLPVIKRVTLKLGKPPTKSLEGGMVKNGPTKSTKSAETKVNNHPQGQVMDDVIVETEQRMPKLNVETHTNVIAETRQIPELNVEAQSKDVMAKTERQTPDLGVLDVETQTQRDKLTDDVLDSSPRLTDVITLGEPLIDIHKSVVNQYHHDNFFSKILKSPKAFRNFEVSNGRIYLRNSHKRILCIPDVLVGERRMREIIISHAHSILAHLGPSKTLLYL
jgi:hypothetical protein